MSELALNTQICLRSTVSVDYIGNCSLISIVQSALWWKDIEETTSAEKLLPKK